MNILIKGMEMPKDGTFNIVYIYGDGHIEMPFWGNGMQTIKGVTAVRVPPHGDLIDQDEYRDEFMNGVYALCSDDSDNYRANAIIDLFDAAPTIIPAEEGERKDGDGE